MYFNFTPPYGTHGHTSQDYCNQLLHTTLSCRRLMIMVFPSPSAYRDVIIDGMACRDKRIDRFKFPNKTKTAKKTQEQAGKSGKKLFSTSIQTGP